MLAPHSVSLSLCVFSIWSLQHGDFGAPSLITWEPSVPKGYVSVESKPGRSDITFRDSSSAVWQHHFWYLLLGSHKSQSIFRERRILLHLLIEKISENLCVCFKATTPSEEAPVCICMYEAWIYMFVCRSEGRTEKEACWWERAQWKSNHRKFVELYQMYSHRVPRATISNRTCFSPSLILSTIPSTPRESSSFVSHYVPTLLTFLFAPSQSSLTANSLLTCHMQSLTYLGIPVSYTLLKSVNPSSP